MKKVFLILFILIFSVACNSKNLETSISKNEIILDRQHNEINLPKNIDKIVSLAPSITETLVDLGISDKIIGVDSYSTSILQNSELPIFDIMNPDLEVLISLKPDIVFASGMSEADGNNIFNEIRKAGIFLTVIPTSNSIKDIIEDIMFIGKITNTEEKSQVIVSSFIESIKEVENKINLTSISDKKTVYFETSSMPYIYTFGKNVFLNEMLEILKVSNIFSEEDGWIAVSEEQIVKRNPDIIFTNSSYLESPIEEIKQRSGWGNIEAIKNNNVFLIDKDSSSRPNENSIKAFKVMAKYLYPELFN